MTYLVDTTVFQRTDATNLGWQYEQVNNDIQSWSPATNTQMQQFRTDKHQLLGPVHNEWEEESAYIESYIQTIPSFTKSPADQLINSFRSEEGYSLDIARHQRWEQSIDYIEEYTKIIPTFTRDGLDQLLNSFRTRSVPLFDTFRHQEFFQEIGHLTAVFNFLVIAGRGAIEQLTRSFRSDNYNKLDVNHYQWEQEIGYIESHVQEIPTFTRGALDSLLNSFMVSGKSKLDVRTHLSLWRDELAVLFPILFPTVDPKFSPAMESLMNSFRAFEKEKFDIFRDQQWEPLLSNRVILDLVFDFTLAGGAVYQLLSGFRSREREILEIRHDYPSEQTIEYIEPYVQSIPGFTSGSLSQLLNSFRSEEGKKLITNLLTESEFKWVGFEPIIELISQCVPAIEQLYQSYRSLGHSLHDPRLDRAFEQIDLATIIAVIDLVKSLELNLGNARFIQEISIDSQR